VFFARSEIRARFAECEPKEYTVWHGRIIGEIVGDSWGGAAPGLVGPGWKPHHVADEIPLSDRESGREK
jgi:hypothetical protein